MRKPTVVTKKNLILFGNLHSLAWNVSAGYINTQKATWLAPSQKLNSEKIVFKVLQVISVHGLLYYYERIT